MSSVTGHVCSLKDGRGRTLNVMQWGPTAGLPHEEDEEDEEEDEEEEDTFFRCNKKQAKAAHVEFYRDYLVPT